MKDINLNLGSGNTKLNGYLNLDMMDMPGVDVVHDLNKSLPYKDGEVSNIYASHILEHFWWMDTNRILRDWHRVLKKGGSLVIWTVDFDLIVYRLMSAVNYSAMMIDANWRICGKEEPEGNAHHSVFTKRYLSLLLTNVGFRKIGLIDPNKYEFKPLHNEINMGMIAVK